MYLKIGVGRIWGRKQREDLTRMRHEPTYKGMTPPSTQNFKTLGLWVFFLIYFSIFSFLPNVRLRLTLEYLTISLSSESHSSTTLIHSPSSGSLLLPEITIRKTFDTGLNCTRPSRKPAALIPLVGRIRGRKHRGDQQKL